MATSMYDLHSGEGEGLLLFYETYCKCKSNGWEDEEKKGKTLRASFMEGSPPRMHPRSKVFSPVHPNGRFLPAFYPLCFRTMVEKRMVTVPERIQMAPLQNQVSKFKSMETKSLQLHSSATMSNVLKYDMYYEQLGGVSMAPHHGPGSLCFSLLLLLSLSLPVRLSL